MQDPQKWGSFVYVDRKQKIYMAHPDYSLLLVEVYDPQTQVVTRTTDIFSNVKDAQIAYRSEVASGGRDKRVFLFEQPQPTKFKRGDNVPVPTTLDTWD